MGYEREGLFAWTRGGIPGVEYVEIESIQDYLDGKEDLDAAVVSAEAGAVITNHESVGFEWARSKDHERFRAMNRLFREGQVV